jgi:hypothetical protein
MECDALHGEEYLAELVDNAESVASWFQTSDDIAESRDQLKEARKMRG